MKIETWTERCWKRLGKIILRIICTQQSIGSYVQLLFIYYNFSRFFRFSPPHTTKISAWIFHCNHCFHAPPEYNRWFDRWCWLTHANGVLTIYRIAFTHFDFVHSLPCSVQWISSKETEKLRGKDIENVGTEKNKIEFLGAKEILRVWFKIFITYKT